MNSPTSIIPSSARLAVPAALLIALVMGCAGREPPDPRGYDRDMNEPVAKGQAGENGSGGINFHYSNKSTDARMDIDLGTTDVYLEMSGKVVDPEGILTAPMASPRVPEEQTGSDQGREPDSRAQGNKNQESAGSDGSNRRQDSPPAKAFPDSVPGEYPEGNGDVTSKVLAGIRRAQELFYQKRYPEALQMARQSLDVQPTAEGHALAGSICYMMAKTGLARRHWDEALRLNPDMPAVVNMLDRTRTPGGRGSPSPRPILARPLAKPPASVMDASGADNLDQAPFPDVLEQPTAPEPAKPVFPKSAPEVKPQEK